MTGTIGVIGTGRLGGAIARKLAAAGHPVVVANSRGPESLRSLVAELGPAAMATTVPGAAVAAGVLILAVPWRATTELFRPATVAGRILVDATNRFPGAGAGAGSSEALAATYPDSIVVKSLNTMRWDHFDASGPEPLAHYVAGDNPAANERVADIVSSLGFAVLDLGGLRTGGRLMEPSGPLFNVLLTATTARTAMGEQGGERAWTSR